MIVSLPHADLIAALPRLRRYARVLVGDVHRADDLLQDTLARAWDKRELWQQGTDLRAWLFTIMHNVFVNQLALRRREHSTASLDAEEGVARGISASGIRSRIVGAGGGRSATGQLPVDQREVLILAAVEEMRYAEIAEMIGVPIGTVMSRLNRAREKLRRLSVEPQGP